MREKPVGLRLVLAYCAFFVAVAAAYATEPNYVRTHTYHDYIDPPTVFVKPPIVSTSYSDGLGRATQAQTKISSTKSIVSGTYYDDAGRVWKTTKPFSHSFGVEAPGYIDMANENLVSLSNARHGTSSFSETRYFDDPLGRAKRVGAPGIQFSLSDLHQSRMWYFGIESENGFFPVTDLDTTVLDAKTQPPTCSHFLAVSKDPNGNFSQTVTDIFGRTLRTKSYTGASSSSGITAAYAYDILGNVLQDSAPSPATGEPSSTLVTKYGYNTLSQLLWKKTPDACSTAYRYDIAGRLKHVKTGSHIQAEKTTIAGNQMTECFLAYKYDNLGRNTRTEEITRVTLNLSSDLLFEKPNESDQNAVALRKEKILNFYDNTEGLSTLGFAQIPAAILNELSNLRGRNVATVAYDETGDKTEEHAVVDLFSYDDEGRLAANYKKIPGVNLQKTTYSYDLIGKVVIKSYYNGYAGVASTPSRVYFYEYNDIGRLVAIRKDGPAGDKMASYNYADEGLLSNRTFIKAGGAEPSASTSYEYNIRDWAQKIEALCPLTNTSFFVQDLKYNDPSSGTAQYNGNIAQSLLQYPSVGDVALSYSYDGVNRLLGTTKSGTIAGDYSEDFTYDRTGRITRKREGTTDLTGYTYEPGTNRLEKITGSATKSGSKNFVYDPNGNMVFDKSKKMVTEYDWRGLPVKFKFYATVQDLAWNELICQGLEKKGHKLVSEVRMAYDASGNRVLKTTYNKASTN